jgi:DNA-directed RNA polymerase specialized sigma24 family protein
VLRHFYGYTNREIGLVIGAHEQTVASRLAAARKQLQITLAHFRSTKNG